MSVRRPISWLAGLNKYKTIKVYVLEQNKAAAALPPQWRADEPIPLPSLPRATLSALYLGMCVLDLNKKF